MRITKGLFSFGAIVVAASIATTSVSIAQQPAPDSPIADAARLRDARQFAAAIDVLRRHRALNPEDGDAVRMLAQTLYWNRDVRGARALYDSGLVLHPADTALRLQYAQTLIETGGYARAREVLSPLVTGSHPDPKATALIGTLAYWEGDLTSARRNFEAALAADPSLNDVRRQLDEIRWLSATWIRMASLGSTDDQPVKSLGAEVEAGYYMNPLWTVTGSVRTVFLTESTTTNPNASSTDLTALAASVGINGFIPSNRIDISARAGLFNRNVPSKLDWTGKADLGVKAGSSVRVGVRAERAPYLYTEASLRTHVMANMAGVSLDVDRKGWLGKAAYELQRFADDNSVSTAYVWAMAPVVHSSVTTLQAGYSASYQDADSLRFTRNSAGLTGHYEPYYTPSNTFVQSVIGAFTGRGESGFTARLSGSFGFRAREDAPSFAVAPNGAFLLTTSNRSFHPWSARAAVEKALTNQVVLRAHVDHAKTAFYHVTNAAIELTWRLGPG